MHFESRGVSRRSFANLASTVLFITLVVAASGCSPGAPGSNSTDTPTPTVPTPGPGNRAPTITGTPSTTAPAGAIYQFHPSAADADGNTLSFSISNLPAWATFDTSTGTIGGTPQTTNVGTYANIVISVSDGSASAALAAFTIQVTPPPNRAPTISGTPLTTVTAGSSYVFQPTGADPDGDLVTFTIQNLPIWATFNAATGRLSGTPTVANAGVYARVTISASDGTAMTTLSAFDITVAAANSPPAISGTPAITAVAGSAYSFTPVAADVDGNALVFSISNMPSWATFNTATGRLQGSPGAGNVGAFANIIIRVSDGIAITSLPAFSISVTAANMAPTISGTPSSSAVVGTAYTFMPTATDANGDALTFSVVNMPSWTTFNTATGRLQGTPATGNVGTFANITIRVTDGTTTTALPAFSIVVTAANTAPTISGSPATSVVVGSAYAFTPTAADVNGDALTFSIANMPSWASFDTTTGKLQGTPSSSNVGAFAGIAISVSDGKATTSLTAFTVTVNATGTANATINWTPPTQNTDGSTLSNLAGYKILYGTSNSNLDQQIVAANPGLSSYVVSNLNSGTYYFAVKAYNADGVDSDPSNIASKVIP